MAAKSCFLTLLQKQEVASFLETIKTKDVDIKLRSSFGSLEVIFSSEMPLDTWIDPVKKRFHEYFLGGEPIEHAVLIAMQSRKKMVGFAESCTGGALAAKLTAMPGASSCLAGSIVAYSNDWKEHFLGLKRDDLLRFGAVSLETARAMASAVLKETNVDYAVAVSGFAGPSGGDGHEQEKVGTICIAVAKRGEEIDAGKIYSSFDRMGSIELAVQTALGALWRRVVHNKVTFS